VAQTRARLWRSSRKLQIGPFETSSYKAPKEV
jgi:hypothetical protein